MEHLELLCWVSVMQGKLSSYLERELSLDGKGHLDIKQFGHGQSNPTYLLNVRNSGVMKLPQNNTDYLSQLGNYCCKCDSKTSWNTNVFMFGGIVSVMNIRIVVQELLAHYGKSLHAILPADRTDKLFILGELGYLAFVSSQMFKLSILMLFGRDVFTHGTS